MQTDVVKLYSKDIKYNLNDGQGEKYTNTHTRIVADKGIYKKKNYNCMGVAESKGLSVDLSMKYFLRCYGVKELAVYTNQPLKL